jgi:asparagine synthetase B (glutamine-hydrolysing)
MKYLPKKALRDHVPDEILLRRKAGFPVPCYFWLRNDLRKWVTEILLDRKTISVGYFRQDARAASEPAGPSLLSIYCMHDSRR